MTKILLVEDDVQIAQSLMMNLKYSGFEVLHAATWKDGWDFFSNNAFHLLLLDINLPDGTGISLCQKIRSGGSDVPILFLSARVDEETVIESLNIGGDDYVRKPFGTEELKVRMKKALNRTGLKRTTIVAGPLTLNLAQRSVMLNGSPVALAKREFDILTALAQRPGDVVTRESIFSFLGEQTEIFDRTIDSHISHLRKKMKDAGQDTVKIASVYGVGYRLEWNSKNEI